MTQEFSENYVAEKCQELGISMPKIAWSNLDQYACYKAVSDKVVLGKHFLSLDNQQKAAVICHELIHKTQRSETLRTVFMSAAVLVSAIISILGCMLLCIFASDLAWLTVTILPQSVLVIIYFTVSESCNRTAISKEIEADARGAVLFGNQDKYRDIMREIWFDSWPPECIVSHSRYQAMGLI